jgi:hypothetical protein
MNVLFLGQWGANLIALHGIVPPFEVICVVLRWSSHTDNSVAAVQQTRKATCESLHLVPLLFAAVSLRTTDTAT